MAAETTLHVPSGIFDSAFSVIITVLGLVSVGFLAVIGFFTKRKNDLQEKTAQADNRLIGLLQGTVTELEKKLTAQTKSLDDAMKRLVTLESENSLLKEVFQGRDQKMQEFIAQGLTSMAQMPQMMTMLTSTSNNVERLMHLLEKHLVSIEEKVTSTP